MVQKANHLRYQCAIKTCNLLVTIAPLNRSPEFIKWIYQYYFEISTNSSHFVYWIPRNLFENWMKELNETEWRKWIVFEHFFVSNANVIDIVINSVEKEQITCQKHIFRQNVCRPSTWCLSFWYRKLTVWLRLWFAFTSQFKMKQLFEFSNDE